MLKHQMSGEIMTLAEGNMASYKSKNGLAVFGVAAIVLIAAIQRPNLETKTVSPSERTDPVSSPMTWAQADRLVTEEETVKARLRDPESAQFQHLNGGCGYVNSRNGFGGMGGPKPFVVGLNNKAVFREDNPKAFDVVWRMHCIDGITPPLTPHN